MSRDTFCGPFPFLFIVDVAGQNSMFRDFASLNVYLGQWVIVLGVQVNLNLFSSLIV